MLTDYEERERDALARENARTCPQCGESEIVKIDGCYNADVNLCEPCLVATLDELAAACKEAHVVIRLMLDCDRRSRTSGVPDDHARGIARKARKAIGRCKAALKACTRNTET